jgi:hypothetical protein
MHAASAPGRLHPKDRDVRLAEVRRWRYGRLQNRRLRHLCVHDSVENTASSEMVEFSMDMTILTATLGISRNFSWNVGPRDVEISFDEGVVLKNA